MTVILLPGAAPEPIQQAPHKGRYPSVVTRIRKARLQRINAEHEEQLVARDVANWEEKLAAFQNYADYCRQELALARQRYNATRRGR
jgi:hypothetical protein